MIQFTTIEIALGLITLLLIINYISFFIALVKTYDNITNEGSNCFYNDIYFTTWRALFKHAIPFYFIYVRISKVVNAFKQLN